MAVSVLQANAMLGAIPGTLYAQIHSADPGPAGTSNAIGGVSRALVSIATAAGGSRAASAVVDVVAVPEAASVAWLSYWDAPTGGTFEFSQPLDAPVTFTYAGRLRLTSQVFSISTGIGAQTSATADLSAGAETNTMVLTVLTSDTSAGSDSAPAGMVVRTATTDTSEGADSNSVLEGVSSITTDLSSQTNTNTVTQTFAVATTDTSGQTDSNTATHLLNAITSPTEGGTASTQAVSFTGTAATGAGVTAELWDGVSEVGMSTGTYLVHTTGNASPGAASLSSGTFSASAGSRIAICVVGVPNGNAHGCSGVAIDPTGANITCTRTVDGGQNYDKTCEIWSATTTNALNSVIVTATFQTATNYYAAVTVFELTSCSSTGATATASGNPASRQVAITPQASGSIILFVAFDDANSTSSTPATDNTEHVDAASHQGQRHIYITSLATTGTSQVTVGATTGTVAQLKGAAAEFKV